VKYGTTRSTETKLKGLQRNRKNEPENDNNDEGRN